jgi:hypothetical protein
LTRTLRSWAAPRRLFSIYGKPLSLYRHQAQTVAKAATGQSLVVTTGTGRANRSVSFIPIIDAAIRARIEGESKRTRAIAIYPMNALKMLSTPITSTARSSRPMRWPSSKPSGSSRR